MVFLVGLGRLFGLDESVRGQFVFGHDRARRSPVQSVSTIGLERHSNSKLVQWYVFAVVVWNECFDALVVCGFSDVLLFVLMLCLCFCCVSCGETGPALLTWSRGQNEYGSNIAGPLPRSWMKGQWHLQQQILKRSRSLGTVVFFLFLRDKCFVVGSLWIFSFWIVFYCWIFC